MKRHDTTHAHTKADAFTRTQTNGKKRTAEKQQREEHNHARLVFFIRLVFVFLFLLSLIVSKADNTTGKEDVTVGEKNDGEFTTQQRKKTIWRDEEEDSAMRFSSLFLEWVVVSFFRERLRLFLV